MSPCYGSTAIQFFKILLVWRWTLDVRIYNVVIYYFYSATISQEY